MSLVDKAKNAAEKLTGQAKETVGNKTDDPNMAADGKKDQAAADLKNAGEKVKDALKD